jgi:phosphatidate cytidylyltransferase
MQDVNVSLGPFGDYLFNCMPVQFYCVIFGLFASLVGPFAGFLASGLKRAYDVKDFGTFFPGHGGWIDRFDC